MEKENSQNKDLFALLCDLHIRNQRQGPGSHTAFQKMLDLSAIDKKANLSIADIGCGTGLATVELLKNTNASLTAVDLLPSFLEKLSDNTKNTELQDRLTIIEADMNNLPFSDNQFDVIWSEGDIYNIGFTNGIQKWRKFLKDNGTIVVSEITWLSSFIPKDLKSHWKKAYPEIAIASEKIKILEENGYTPISYFVLPPECWLEQYYTPLAKGFKEFLKRHQNSEIAQTIVQGEKQEIQLYKKYQNFYSYGVYIAKKRQ